MRCAPSVLVCVCVCAWVFVHRDVRTREAGIQDIHHKVRPDEVELIRRDYAANKGWEVRACVVWCVRPAS